MKRLHAKVLFYFTAVFFLIFLFQNNSDAANGVSTLTNDAYNVTSNSAILSGDFNNPNGVRIVRRGFQLGTDPDVLWRYIEFDTDIRGNGGLTHNQPGLLPNTIYYYKFNVVDDRGNYVYGNVKSFRTRPIAKSDVKELIPKKTIVYDGHVYALYDINTTWFDSRGFCNDMGGHLLSVNNISELNAIKALFTAGEKEFYWTDGVSRDSRTRWMWSAERSTITYTNWRVNQPDNYAGNQDFIATDKNGQWVDLDDEDARTGFICEIDDYSNRPQWKYGGNTYIRFDEGPGMTMTWDQAKAFCESMGGHLVTISSADEQEEVWKLLTGGSEQFYWTDGIRINNGTKWAWSTGELFGYTNWKIESGEPNNTGGKQNCIAIERTRKWSDFAGDGSDFDLYQMGFVCEIEGPKTATLNKNKYQLFENRMSWKDAKAYCESIGGHLATITSQQEQSAIENLISKGSRTTYLIGMSDESRSGSFKWVTNEPFQYSNWETGQPNNFYGYQQYGRLFVSGTLPFGQWDDCENYTGLERTQGFICEFENAVTIPVTGVELSSVLETMPVRSTRSLIATVKPLNADNKKIIWESSNSNVVTIDATGKVTAVNEGMAIITAKTAEGGFLARCTIVAVEVPVIGISLNKSIDFIEIGSTLQIEATVNPINATNKNVLWESSDDEVVSVDTTGKVTAISVGAVAITAKTVDGGYSGICYIFVEGPVTNVTLNRTTEKMEVGSTLKLTAFLQPSLLINDTVTWKSSNPSIATVDANGMVTGVAEGRAYITVTTEDGGYTATCTVDVMMPVTGISINYSEHSIILGSSSTIIASIIPLNATNKTVKWSSSNLSVAVVNEAGMVTGRSKGKAIITAKSEDGGFEASCTINVIVPVTGIELNDSERKIDVGTTSTLVVNIIPSNASNRNEKWSSSNPTVASVSADGNVNALMAGTTTITVQSEDGGYSAACVIHVIMPVNGIEISSIEELMAVDNTVTLSAVVRPVNASNKNVVWSSSEPLVATVNDSGCVTAVSKGKAIVTAETEDGGFVAECMINVLVPVTGIELSSQEETMEAGATLRLDAVVKPSIASNKEVTWKSNHPEIAEVSSGGAVKAVAEGTAIISATTVDGGFEAECIIHVFVPVNGIKLNSTSEAVKVGDSVIVSAVVKPSNATNKNVLWESSNSTVATVDKNGMITGISSGTAVVTVKTEEGNFSGSCVITVSQKQINLAFGQTVNASHTSGTATASKAVVDGKAETRWAAPSNTTNVTLEIDFEEMVTFDKIKLIEFGDRVNDFHIEYWNGVEWKLIHAGETIGTDFSIDFPRVTGSKVRLYVVSTKGVYGVSIAEFEVYDMKNSQAPEPTVPTPPAIIVGEDLALNATVIASSVSGSNTAKKAVDGDSDTRWGAQNSMTNVTVDIDFGKRVTFNQVKINEYGDRIANYVLQYWNGVNWTDIQSGTTMGEEFITEFDDVTTDKLRLLVVSTKGVYGASISDFEVYDVK